MCGANGSSHTVDSDWGILLQEDMMVKSSKLAMNGNIRLIWTSQSEQQDRAP
jgi:hypothetical protein